MEPDRIARAIKRFWILILALAVVGGAVGVVRAKTGDPVYKSTATALIASDPSNGSQNVSGSAIVVGAIAPTLVEMGTSNSILSAVSKSTGTSTDALKGLVSVSNPTGTLLIEVSATGSTPEKARTTAAAEMKALGAATKDMTLAEGTSAASLALNDVDKASLPTAPVGPSKTRYGLVGIIVGGLVGLVVALIADSRRKRGAVDVGPAAVSAAPTADEH